MDNPKSLLFWHITHTDVDYAALGWALTSSVWAHMLMLLIALTCVYIHPLSVFDDAWLQEQMWANAGRTREKEKRTDGDSVWGKVKRERVSEGLPAS